MFRMRSLLAILATVLAVVLAGCVERTSDDPPGDGADDVVAAVADDSQDDDVTAAEIEALELLGFDSAEDVELPELDVETLTAETPALTLEAQAWENTFVGEVTDDLFIGIALDSADPAYAREIRVYICDNHEVATVLAGELADGQVVLADQTVEIELLASGNEITGTVALAGDNGEAFTATPATGNAGVYVVKDTVNDAELWGGWIVLEDGRQRGDVRICIFFPVVGTVCAVLR